MAGPIQLISARSYHSISPLRYRARVHRLEFQIQKVISFTIDLFESLQLGIHFLLLDAVQIILTAGVGGVFILGYATRDLFLEEENRQPGGPRFTSEYQELMWLAERQRGHASAEERQRFYQLRHNWSEMHSYGLTGGL